MLAVSDDAVLALERDKKDVPRTKASLINDTGNQIDTCTTELPYEGVLANFGFILTTNPLGAVNKDEITKTVFDECTVHKTPTGNKKDVKLRL